MIHISYCFPNRLTENIAFLIEERVDSVHNNVTLIDLHAAVALIIEQQDTPLDNDDPVLRERMSRLIGQLERGEYVTNDEMKRQVRQWLTK